MTDRGKVIEHIADCVRIADCQINHNWVFVRTEILKDALAMLKEQEARVMTLEEVLDMKFDDVVYLQVNPTNAVLSAIVIDVIQKLPEINVGVVQFRHGAGYNGINNADLSYYGKTWCCWTSRPTDEQRRIAKWEKSTSVSVSSG